MKFELIINDNNYDSIDELPFDDWLSPYDYSLSVRVDKPEDLDRVFHEEEQYKKYIKSQEVTIDPFYLDEDNPSQRNINYLKSKTIDELLKESDIISFVLENSSIKDYLLKNPILQTKNIVLEGRYGLLSKNEINRLIEKYKDILKPEQMYINMYGNLGYVNVLDALKTIDMVNEIAEKQAKLNLSPMENIMYTYDLVRNRVYKEENENESPNASRNLCNVMLGDKIVCVGYSVLFSTILNYIGIDMRMTELKRKDGSAGHERCVAYVKDDKYDIDGVYYFDPTWDSKMKGDYNNFLYRYLFFGLPDYKIKELDKGRYTEDSYLNLDDDTVFNAYELCEEYKSSKFNFDFMRKAKDLVKSLRNSFSMVNGIKMPDDFSLINDPACLKKYIEENEDLIDEVVDKVGYGVISGEKMLKLFNNVRKIEYYQNPEFYPYGIDEVYRTFFNNWDFLDDNDYYLVKLFSRDSKKLKELKEHVFGKFCRENGIFRDIVGVKLTRTLKNELDRRKKEESV